MKKAFLISLSIFLMVAFLNIQVKSQNSGQAYLNEDGKILLEEASLEIYKYSVDIASLNFSTVEEINTHFSKIKESQYFEIEVISVSEINLKLIRRNLFRNAYWDVNEWNQLLNTL